VTLDFDLDLLTWLIVGTTLLLAIVQLVAGFAGSIGYRFHFTPLFSFFNTDGNLTFNAWFGSLVMAASGIGALSAARSSQDRARVGFVTLAVIMFYFSLEKATAFHDWLVPRIIDVKDPKWALTGLVVLAVLLVYLALWVRRLPVPVKVGLIVGGIVFVFGAVFLDDLGDLLSGVGASGWRPNPIEVLEEIAEIAGVLIISRTCFLAARGSDGEFAVRQVFRPGRVRR
jgi:hypothetical protein